MGILPFLLIGLIAGWLAGKIMNKNSDSLLRNLVVGVVGSWLGSFLFGLLGLGGSNVRLVGSLATALIGAIALLWIIDQVKK